MVALGGVVVDDVEDHLDPGAVERLHHPLELAHLLAARPGRRVEGVRREEADRGVAPVVRQAPLGEELLVGDVVHREQLDGGDAEVAEVRDRGLRGEARVRAAEVLAHAGHQLREALHVHLVDHRLVPRRRRRPVVLPRERVVDDDALRDRGGVVLVVRDRVGDASELRRYGSGLPRSQRIGPSIAFAYGSMRSFAGLNRWPRRGRGAVDAVAVPLAGADARQVAVPVEGRALGDRDPRLDVGSSKRHSSTRWAFSENSEKFVPWPSHTGPSGNGRPGQTSISAPPGGLGESLVREHQARGRTRPKRRLVAFVRTWVDSGASPSDRGAERDRR